VDEAPKGRVDRLDVPHEHNSRRNMVLECSIMAPFDCAAAIHG